MIKLNFNGTIVFGRGDSNTYITEYEVTQDEYNRLLESYKSQKYMRLCDDDSLSDVYGKVYQKAVEIDIDELKWDEDYLNDLMSDYLGQDPEDEDFEFSDDDIYDMMESYWTRYVGYPEEFEKIELDDEE